MELIAGIEISLGGAAYIVPPLNLASIERYQKRLQEYKEGFDAASMSTLVEVTAAALKRNYPTLGQEWFAKAVEAAKVAGEPAPKGPAAEAFLREWIDVGNMGEIMRAVMDVGGLRRAEIETGKATAQSQPTGPTSTPT